MEIKSTFETGKLTIAIVGSVNAAEASNLQQGVAALVNEYDDAEQIVIDATDMDFISSMGLRVFLSLMKKHIDMRIIGVNPDVYKVFNLTGITKLIPVEQALAQVSIEGCELVAGTTNLYCLTDETVVKVFRQGTTRADIEREVELAKEVFVLGVPTAMAFEIVKVDDGRLGLIYESTTPAKFDAQTIGDVLRNLHEVKVEPDGKIPSSVEREKKNIKSLEPYLGKDAVAKLLQLLSAVPDGSSLLYGNTNVDHVMLQNGEPIMTDMSEVGYGNPILDLAHLYSSLSAEDKEKFFDDFLRSYYDMESDEVIAKNKENIIVLSVIRDFTKLTRDGEPTDEEVEKYNDRFEMVVDACWDVMLSRLKFKMDFHEEILKLERKGYYLDSDVSIDWIAQKLGTNRHYVSDYFNKVLHITFNDYINTLRLEHAARLLKEGRMSLAQIAYSSGFNNDHTFRRLFKARYGCSPSQYAER